jgi:hypothetical protein
MTLRQTLPPFQFAISVSLTAGLQFLVDAQRYWIYVYGYDEASDSYVQSYFGYNNNIMGYCKRGQISESGKLLIGCEQPIRVGCSVPHCFACSWADYCSDCEPGFQLQQDATCLGISAEGTQQMAVAGGREKFDAIELAESIAIAAMLVAFIVQAVCLGLAWQVK